MPNLRSTEMFMCIYVISFWFHLFSNYVIIHFQLYMIIKYIMTVLTFSPTCNLNTLISNKRIF